MPSQTKITCDGCGRDRTWTGNSVDYRLALVVQRIPAGPPDRNGSVSVFDMMIHPPIDQDAYFCGLDCLDKWRSTVAVPVDYRCPERDGQGRRCTARRLVGMGQTVLGSRPHAGPHRYEGTGA